MELHNDSEVIAALKAPIQSAVNYMMEEVKTENTNKIAKTVYSGYSPTWYVNNRTHQFMFAWKAEEDDGVGDLGGADFNYDPSRLSVGSQETGQHASIVDGSPFTEGLADVIYQGYSMPRNGVRIPKRNAFQKLDRWFSEKQIGILFDRGLRRAGVKVATKGGATKTII